MGFASDGVMYKLGALYFYSSSVLVDSFVLRNRQLLVAANRSFSASSHLWRRQEMKSRSCKKDN